MKKATIIIIFPILFVFCRPARPSTAMSALECLLKKNAAHTSISYKVNFRMKYFSSKDTSRYLGYCKLVKNDKDTLFHGYVWYSLPTWHLIYYYGGDYLYLIRDSLKNITSFSDPENKYGWIQGNTSGHLINTVFLDTLFNPKRAIDTIITQKLTHDTINGNDYWKIKLNYKGDDEVSNRERCIWINPKDSTLKKITFKCTLQGQNEYEEWDLDSIQYDKDTYESVNSQMSSRLSSYTINPYVPPTPESEKPLTNNTVAPEFTGVDFSTGKKVSLKNYRGKLVLLDFWYMDCVWCIRAMPSIEKIDSEYRSKGVVILGINSFDTTEEKKHDLPAFIKINKNTYPTILTSRSTDKLYNIHAYPTLYLINKKGEISFSEVGYKKGMDSILKAEINKIK